MKLNRVSLILHKCNMKTTKFINKITINFQFISSHTSEVLSGENFGEIELQTLIDITKMENLKISNELDIFYAIERYANAQSKKNQNNHNTVQHSDLKSMTENSTLSEVSKAIESNAPGNPINIIHPDKSPSELSCITKIEPEYKKFSLTELFYYICMYD